MLPSGAPKKSLNKIVFVVVVGFLVIVRLYMIFQGHSRISSDLALQSEDYAAARKHFQTHLLRHGPAPQNGQPLRPPPGAQQVEYAPELHLQAWTTPPTTGTKKPDVLFLHGGFAIGNDDWDMTQPYQDAGYIVLVPALRGENGQPGDYSMFYDEVTDVLAAADYLAQRPDVDAQHIYIAGHSVGGTLTLLAALASPRFQAAASFSGTPDAIGWSRGQPERVPFDTSQLQEYRMRSAAAYAGSFKCPTRLYCGSQETFFVDAAQQTASRARKQGRDVQAISVPGDHFTAVPAEIQQSIQFFQSH